ncbi:MAG TPA: HAMP domain-containing sensor histidine kinase [Clostridia bacterium]|nr:HAMP domain-containing sensor histidine kinase [Clostridia bacterium]
MTGHKTKRFKKILSASLRFMLAFILLTVIYVALNVAAFLLLTGDRPMHEYVPTQQSQNPASLNWQGIHELGGYGYVVDQEGSVLWQSQGRRGPETLSPGDLLNQHLTRENKRTGFIYTTPEGNWLVLNYPSDTFSCEPAYVIDSSPVHQRRTLAVTLIGLILLYLLGIFFLFHRLSIRLEKNVQEIYEAEEEEKRFFFRGLAHDIKTPLAAIMACSRALTDGLVQAEQFDHYLDTIYRQSGFLKDRLDDMMAYATLKEQLSENMMEGDLLEAVRRYVGENFTWFSEHAAEIEIRFHDDESCLTAFDPALFARLLQNILVNSVQHNEPGVSIHIDWDAKEKCLRLGDDGPGIPESLRDTVFEPMVTADPSRTGERFRGMGLANVKRIAQLHGWKIEYDGEFKIKIDGD